MKWEKLKMLKKVINKKNFIDFGFIALATLILSWVTIYNRFPLTYGDTSGYITRAFTREVDHHWALFYSLFIRITTLNHSIIFTAIFQNLLMAWLIFKCLEIVPFGSRRRNNWIYTFVVLILATFTSLPYVSNLIMSDVFTSIGILSVILFLIGSKNLATDVIYALIFMSSVIAHNSHQPIFLSGLIFLGIIRILSQNKLENWLKTKRIIWLIVLLVFAGHVYKPLVNAYFVNIPKTTLDIEAHNQVSDSKYHFVWNKLKADSLAYQKFLMEYCPSKNYKYLCTDSRMDSIHNYGFRKIFHSRQNEAFYREMEDAGRQIVLDPKYLFAVLSGSINKILYLFMNTNFPDNKRLGIALRVYKRYFEYFPDEELRIKDSKLHNSEINLTFGQWALSKWIIYFSYAVLLLLTLRVIIKRNRIDLLYIPLTLFLFVICNNVLIGIFGNVLNGRYLGRVSWLLIFGIILFILHWLNFDKKEELTN